MRHASKYWAFAELTRLLCCRGISYSLRPTQIAFVLPGRGYTDEDLQAVSAAAQAACSDEKLMELAWEVRWFPYSALADQAYIIFS